MFQSSTDGLAWTIFSRPLSSLTVSRTDFIQPTDIYIDENDVMYVTDTQTSALPSWYGERRPEDWVRGIRVGDAGTGRVMAFIESNAEFVAVDRAGNVYGGEVPGQRLVKYEKVR